MPWGFCGFACFVGLLSFWLRETFCVLVMGFRVCGGWF